MFQVTIAYFRRAYQEQHEIFCVDEQLLCHKGVLHAPYIRKAFFQPNDDSKLRSSGYTVIPINPGGHWVVVLIDWSHSKIVKFDSLQKRENYAAMSAFEKNYLAQIMKSPYKNQPQFAEFQKIEDDRWKQRDSCNCGVFVLAYVESYINGEFKNQLSDEDLSKLRYRYFKQALQGLVVGNLD